MPERIHVHGGYTTTDRTLHDAIQSYVADRSTNEPGREQFLSPFMLCRSCNHEFGYFVGKEAPPATCGRCGSSKLVRVTLEWSR